MLSSILKLIFFSGLFLLALLSYAAEMNKNTSSRHSSNTKAASISTHEQELTAKERGEDKADSEDESQGSTSMQDTIILNGFDDD